MSQYPRAFPPGPSGVLRQTLRYAREPFALYADSRAEFGPVFTVPTLTGRVVVAGDADAVRDVFSADPESLEPYSPATVAPFVGDLSVLNAAGPRHARVRKLLAPAFHGPQLKAYGRTFVRAAAEATASWDEGAVITAQDVMCDLSLDLILRTVFGVEAHDRARFAAAMRTFIGCWSKSVTFFPVLRHRLFRPWAALEQATAALDALLYEQIAERRLRGNAGTDVLGMLLAARYDDGAPMADSEVRDHLLTLLFAGHETLTTSLSWALYDLHRSPRALAALTSELDALESAPGDASSAMALARLPYLDAVCSESLRLHPVLPDVIRRVVTPLRVGGYLLPPGTGVAASISLVHSDPSLYPEPMAFRPERFLEGRFSAFEYFPFGGGARRCLGAAFALTEMKLVLATVVRGVKLAVEEGAEIPSQRHHITMGPAAPIRLRVVARRTRPSVLMRVA